MLFNFKDIRGGASSPDTGSTTPQASAPAEFRSEAADELAALVGRRRFRNNPVGSCSKPSSRIDIH